LTVGISNICSSVQDHRPNVISYKGSGRTNKEQKKHYLKHKALLKICAPEDLRSWRVWRHQKKKVLRSWFFRSCSISPKANWFKFLWI